ncbi:hypothetical protein ACLK1U_22100 [Escherichia coli]
MSVKIVLSINLSPVAAVVDLLAITALSDLLHISGIFLQNHTLTKSTALIIIFNII